ncbi:MAG: hypothetical protein ACREEM_08260 [Blastocatellia bacterium]
MSFNRISINPGSGRGLKLSSLTNSTKLKALLLVLFALALPALAQEKSVGFMPRVEIVILSVTKEDANAKPNPKSAGRLVPVKIQWKTSPWKGARLVELEARLTTSNTDKSNAEVKKTLQVTGAGDTLLLPMPDGVFAKEFKLTLTGKCSFTDKNGVSGAATSRATKTGTFPLPAEKR